jgi:hypothetical protein
MNCAPRPSQASAPHLHRQIMHACHQGLASRMPISQFNSKISTSDQLYDVASLEKEKEKNAKPANF